MFKTISYALLKILLYPKERVTRSTPFECIGLDYLGLINVSTNNGITKHLIALFTCMVTKAIHLKPIPNQSTVGFLHCFNRFIFEIPKFIISIIMLYILF